MGCSDVCGYKHAKHLDNGFRKLIHNPYKMFREYIRPGSTVLDIGCGPGAFTLDLAKMTGKTGKVIAVDLQKEMLEMVRKKVLQGGMCECVDFHQCSPDDLGIDTEADFILTFFMVHEVPDVQKLIGQIYNRLKKGGIYYLAEPAFHVTSKVFQSEIDYCTSLGLKIVKSSGLITKTVVFQK